METINAETNVKEKFEKLRSDLKFKHKILRTQSELVNMLVDSFKFHRKGGKE